MTTDRRLDGQKIRQYLIENKKTREWMAVQLGVSTATVQHLLAGKVPRESTLYGISQLLKLPIESLFIQSRKQSA